MKKAYIFAQGTVNDPESIQAYYEATPPVIEKFGGTVIVFSNAAKNMEGSEFSTWAVLEFPSLENAVDYYDSDLYQKKCKPLRTPFSEFTVNIVEALPS